MKYSQIPVDTFQKLTLNAGILVDSFDPNTGEIGNILGATKGGITFNSNPTFSDFGEDIDNCPNNMKELKRLESYDPTMSGSFLTCTPELARSLVGPADVSDTIRVIPRQVLLQTDFTEVWWIGDYSDVNTGEDAGYMAIHLLNALNQSGFQMTSAKNSKVEYAFEYHGHYSIDAQETVPFEIYIKQGNAEIVPSITLNTHVATVVEEGTVTLQATVVPADATITWTSSDTEVATVNNGTVTGVAAGNTIIMATITVEGISYSDVCTVVVTAAESG